MRSWLRQAAVSVRAVLALSVVLVALLIATVLAYHDRDLGVMIGLIGAIGLLASIGAGELAANARALRDARAELSRRNTRLEGMFMAAKIGMALTDQEGRWVLVNPALCSMLGYSRAELEGRRFQDITHPGDHAESQRAFEPVRDGERGDAEIEKRYIARDGRVILAKVTASAFSDWIDGRRVQVAQIKDITERRRTELELKRERQLLSSFLRTTSYRMSFKDLDGRYVRVSDAQAARLGLACAAEAVGKTDFDLRPAEQAARSYEAEQEIIRTGVAVNDREEREVLADGQETWEAVSTMPLRHGDGIVGTISLAHDITVRKHAEQELRKGEERWRTLLAEVREIVTLVDADGRISYVSPAVTRWLGYEPEQAIGRDVTTGTHPDDVPALADALARATPEMPVRLIRRVSASDGSWRTMESTIVYIRDEPVLGAMLFTSHDVTERVALEQERERLELDRRVSQRLEAVGQLASGIAHEINTPLQFVGDSVVFLREATDELLKLAALYREALYGDAPVPVEERRRVMREAEEEADIDYLCERIPVAFTRTLDGVGRVRSIVQAMKRFSHDSGTEFAAADLNEALKTTLAVCRNEYKYVADVVTRLGELPLIDCNIGELNQVFLNLVLNAAQAIQDKVGNSGERGTIRIATRLAGSEVVVEVADDGPGIPVELQDRIYEPFFTTKEVGRGTGQGLALARNTVDRHAGLLHCTSVPGAGATFTIRLPVRSGSEPMVQAA